MKARPLALAVAVASVACYANTLSADFVAGDLQFIVDNESIKHATVLRTAFTKGYWWVGADSVGGTYYRPLVVLLDALDQALWGGRPAGFHLTNLLLHLAASLAVLALARAWTRSPFAAAYAALLFAVHPIHVGATSYVSARTALLCTLFATGAALAALRWRSVALTDGPSRARATYLLAALACYAGALLSGEAAVSVPVLLAGALLPPRARRRVWLAELLPFACATVLLTAGYLGLRHAVLGTAISHKEALWQHLSPAPATLTMAKILAFYLAKLVVPTELSYLPPFVPVLRAGDPTGLLSFAILVALVVIAAAGPRRFARERAALGWILVTLLPVSGIFPLDHFVKAHYAYLPSVGAAILAASLARRALRAASRPRPRPALRLALGGALGVVVFALALQTVLDNLTWRDTPSLYARALALEPEIPDELFAHPVMTPTANRFATVHLGTAARLVAEGRCDEAMAHAARVRRLTRQRAVDRQARELTAECLFSLGLLDEALALYVPLVDEAPSDPVPPLRAAMVELRQRDPAAAMPFLSLACERGARAACEEEARLKATGGGR
jgi:tetratricopeptide (TPR) repeat protein